MVQPIPLRVELCRCLLSDLLIPLHLYWQCKFEGLNNNLGFAAWGKMRCCVQLNLSLWIRFSPIFRCLILALQGYFASWVAVSAAAMALGFTASAFQTSVKGLGALMGLLASSIIVIIALIDWVGHADFLAESIYAMVVACITVLLVLFHIYIKGNGGGDGMFMFLVLAFFALLWLVLACLVTFRGPFIATGNGYFASVSVSALEYIIVPFVVDCSVPTVPFLSEMFSSFISLLPAFLNGHSGPELRVPALPASLLCGTLIRFRVH